MGCVQVSATLLTPHFDGALAMSTATENTPLLHAENDSGDILAGREVEVYRPGKSTFTQTVSRTFVCSSPMTSAPQHGR